MFTAGCDSVKWIFFPFGFSFFVGEVFQKQRELLGYRPGGGLDTVDPDPDSFRGILEPVSGWGPRGCPGPDLCLAAALVVAGGGADFLLLPASRGEDNNESERGGAGARPGFLGPVAPWPGASPLLLASTAFAV